MVPWFSFAQPVRPVQAWRDGKDGPRSPGCSAIARAASAAKKLRYAFYPSSVHLSRSHRLVPMRAILLVILTTIMHLSPCHDTSAYASMQLGRVGMEQTPDPRKILTCQPWYQSHDSDTLCFRE